MNTVSRIVVFRNNFRDREKQLALLRKHGATVTGVFSILNAIAVELAANAEGELTRAPEVVRIDSNERVVEAL